MKKETQLKLARLAKIDEGNRATSKRYIEKLKSQGKRQVSIILDDVTKLKLSSLRAESIKDGKPLTYGDIIKIAINEYVKVDKKEIVKSDVRDEVKESVKADIKTDVKEVQTDNLKTDVKEVPSENVKSDVSGDLRVDVKKSVKSDKDTEQKDLKKVLSEIKHGDWARQAKDLNAKGIKTSKGLSWTPGNLRAAYNRLKK